MIRTLFVVLSVVLLAGAVTPVECSAQQDPVKWSAPMNDYPTQWNPTAAPPSNYNPYGYHYPYGAYGYGYQGQYPAAYQGNQYYGGQTGNPYYGYYGQ